MQKIPLMDLEAQFKSLEPEIRQAIEATLKNRSFIQGPQVEQFNRDFLDTHGGQYGTGCANGTSAITVALRALAIQPGDEVLVPNHTFFGTTEPIVELGAVPVLVDIDPIHWQLDLADAQKKCTSRTRVIIPVHLYGSPEPMNQVMDFAHANNLRVIEDCAQAHLAKWNGQPVGTFGDLATFSFYPGKNLGAFGDAGFIMARDAKQFTFVKRYIDHGRSEKYRHEFFGGNFRMDGMQAAILSAKLKKLPQWTVRRQELARAYDEIFNLKKFAILQPRPGGTPVYHLYPIQVSNRDEVMAHLKANSIECGIHYPITMNQQPAFSRFGYKAGQFPVSETLAARVLSLPLYPEMTLDQLQQVADVFLQVARS